MKVRMHLAALTRVELSVDIEVPDGTSEEVLDTLLAEAYDDADGDAFREDTEFWEKGSCYHEILEA